MHRHGYRGTKFGRQRGPRQALIKSLAESLILNEAILTSLPKARAVAAYTEKLITKAKKTDLHNRRQVIKGLSTLDAAHKLVDEISPKLAGRTSGYFKITRSTRRRGDNSQLAKVVFVDKLADIKAPAKKAEAAKKPTAKADQPQQPTTKIQADVKPEVETVVQAHTPQIKEPPKRAGRRGNR